MEDWMLILMDVNGFINQPITVLFMWVKQCHKPPMTGNGKHTTYKNDEII
jgi:hypothetical protein